MSSSDPIRAARRRLALRFAFVVAALIVGSGFSVYAYTRQVLLDAFDAAHDLALNSVLENVAPGSPRARVDRREFELEFDELNVSLGVVAVKVWSADGETLAEAALDHTPLLADGPARELRGEGNRMVVVRRRRFGDGETGGIVAVSRRAGDVALELASLRRGLMIIVPIALLGALGIGWIMASQSLRPVKRAFERQRAFMADTSHELRTPLSIIRTQAEIHQDGDAPQMRTALAIVARTAVQLSNVVDDLTFLARADAAALSPRCVAFSLDDLVEEAVEAFEPEAKIRGSRLVLDPRSQDTEIKADPSQIHRLVALLIDNALRHADPGDIEVSIGRAGGIIELRVEDGGPGVSPELLPRVFDRFVRDDVATRTGEKGLGLGLAIAASIVHAHRGSIRLQRGTRGGVAAIVQLPRS